MQNTRRKPCPLTLCSQQIPYGNAWNRTRAFSVSLHFLNYPEDGDNMLLQNARLYTNLQGVLTLQPAISGKCKSWLKGMRNVIQSSLTNHDVISKCVSGNTYRSSWDRFICRSSMCKRKIKTEDIRAIPASMVPIRQSKARQGKGHKARQGKGHKARQGKGHKTSRYKKDMNNCGETRVLNLGLRTSDGPTVHTRIKNNIILWALRSSAMLHGEGW